MAYTRTSFTAGRLQRREFRLHLESDVWDGTGRVEACEPPRRQLVTTKEVDEPYDEVIEATLTADGDQAVLVIEIQCMP